MSAEIVDYASLTPTNVRASASLVEETQAVADRWPLGRRLRLIIALAVVAWILVGGFVWVVGWALGLT